MKYSLKFWKVEANIAKLFLKLESILFYEWANPKILCKTSDFFYSYLNINEYTYNNTVLFSDFLPSHLNSTFK